MYIYTMSICIYIYIFKDTFKFRLMLRQNKKYLHLLTASPLALLSCPQQWRISAWRSRNSSSTESKESVEKYCDRTTTFPSHKTRNTFKIPPKFRKQNKRFQKKPSSSHTSRNSAQKLIVSTSFLFLAIRRYQKQKTLTTFVVRRYVTMVWSCLGCILCA